MISVFDPNFCGEELVAAKQLQRSRFFYLLSFLSTESKLATAVFSGIHIFDNFSLFGSVQFPLLHQPAKVMML